MNTVTATVLFVLAASAGISSAGSLSRNRRQVFPREFENVNIETYLRNRNAVRFQLRCILDNGPCDNIGKLLKTTIPELLRTYCENCNESERDKARMLLSHIQQNFPVEWERSVKKFGGGLVNPEDAAKLESSLGIKLESRLIARVTETPTTTSAPIISQPTRATTVIFPSEEGVSSTSTWTSTTSTTPVPEFSSTDHYPTTTTEEEMSSLLPTSSTWDHETETPSSTETTDASFSGSNRSGVTYFFLIPTFFLLHTSSLMVSSL